MEIKEFTVDVTVIINGNYYRSNQKVTGDTDINLVKQLLDEAHKKVSSQIDVKFVPKKKLDPYDR